MTRQSEPHGRRCRWTRKRLSAFAGGDLSAGGVAAVRAHLVACPECRCELGGWLRARKALRPDGLDGVPDVDGAFFADLHADIMARVGEQPMGQVAASGSPVRRRWLAAAAAAVLLFAIGLWSVQAWSPRHGMLDRSPMPMAGTAGPPGHAPGSGLQPLGGDVELSWDGTGEGHGLMGRLRLRTLERESLRPPVRSVGEAVPDPEQVEDGGLSAMPTELPATAPRIRPDRPR